MRSKAEPIFTVGRAKMIEKFVRLKEYNVAVSDDMYANLRRNSSTLDAYNAKGVESRPYDVRK